MASTQVTVGEMALGVATAGRFFTDCKRFFWRSSSDCTFEYANNFVSLPRCSGLEFSYCHYCLLQVAIKVNGLALADGDESFLVGSGLAAKQAALCPT